MKVEWIEKVLGAIAANKDHFALLQEARKSRKKIEELELEKREAERCLRKVGIEMVYKDFGIHTISNYRILVVEGFEWSCILKFF